MRGVYLPKSNLLISQIFRTELNEEVLRPRCFLHNFPGLQSPRSGRATNTCPRLQSLDLGHQADQDPGRQSLDLDGRMEGHLRDPWGVSLGWALELVSS